MIAPHSSMNSSTLTCQHAGGGAGGGISGAVAHAPAAVSERLPQPHNPARVALDWHAGCYRTAAHDPPCKSGLAAYVIR
jgi:hypothetical protein